MNRITEITKRDILDLFQNGLEIDEFFQTRTVTYNYYGRLEEIDFLKRLYDLERMPSFDSRFANAEQDIWQHTVNNDDYPYCWVFEDKRFNLQDGSDEVYLKFLCEVFHPAVRYDKGYWKEFLVATNKLLQNDGYEIYPAEKISNRDVYGWRIYQQEDNTLFIPYSQRNAKDIKAKKIVLSIKRKARNQIYQFLERYNIVYQATDETGWNYNTTVAEDVFNEIRQFYVPKCYNDKKEYVETADLQAFILSNSPFCVLDAIEFFAKHSISDDFEPQINAILKLNEIPFQLSKGKLMNTFDTQINKNSLVSVQEVGLKELLQEASKYYDENNLQIAVEKLWDAFERLKTYYCSSTVDKKKSVNKIIMDMGNNQQPFLELFEKEFHELTISQTDFELHNDGGSITSNCWKVTWYEDYVEVILSGEEQFDEQVILYFDGTKEIQQLTDIVKMEADYPSGIKMYYGTSSIYSKSDMDAAIKIIMKEFEAFEGCELHSLVKILQG